MLRIRSEPLSRRDKWGNAHKCKIEIGIKIKIGRKINHEIFY